MLTLPASHIPFLSSRCYVRFFLGSNSFTLTPPGRQFQHTYILQASLLLSRFSGIHPVNFTFSSKTLPGDLVFQLTPVTYPRASFASRSLLNLLLRSCFRYLYVPPCVTVLAYLRSRSFRGLLTFTGIPFSLTPGSKLYRPLNRVFLWLNPLSSTTPTYTLEVPRLLTRHSTSLGLIQ